MINRLAETALLVWACQQMYRPEVLGEGLGSARVTEEGVELNWKSGFHVYFSNKDISLVEKGAIDDLTPTRERWDYWTQNAARYHGIQPWEVTSTQRAVMKAQFGMLSYLCPEGIETLGSAEGKVGALLHFADGTATTTETTPAQRIAYRCDRSDHEEHQFRLTGRRGKTLVYVEVTQEDDAREPA